MRVLPEAMTAALEGGATTLCRCWEVRREDGVVLGFTDHDRDLAFDGVIFEAEAGLSTTAAEMSTGLNIDTHSVTGALQSEAITDADLDAGVYDSAQVTLWMVDWTNVANRLLLSRGFIGEVRRQGSRFEAEVVGLAERLNQPVGRAYLHRCNAQLGDTRCGVDLSQPQWSGQGIVSAVLDTQSFEVTGMDGFETGFFSGGGLSWTSGVNSGLDGHVKRHAKNAAVRIELWLSSPSPMSVGDGIKLTAGCDKRAETCRAKFSNFSNFRGFPHMPGDDWAAGYPQDGGAHDGGSLNRS